MVIVEAGNSCGEISPADSLSRKNANHMEGSCPIQIRRVDTTEIVNGKNDQILGTKCQQESLTHVKKILDSEKDIMDDFDTLQDNCSTKSSIDDGSIDNYRSSSSSDLVSSDFDPTFNDQKESRQDCKYNADYEDEPGLEEDDEIDSEDNSILSCPDEESLKRIASMVMYYLSDDNLERDMFLLKHVTKNKEGFVSLKLLSKYKKIKRISKDWRHVKIAIKDSPLFEVNSEGTKVRRKDPLPSELEYTSRPFRSILAYDIPVDIASMDKLAEIFGAFGEMNSLQIHKPGGRVLQEVQKIAREMPKILNTVCAIVEYEKVLNARQAFKALTNNQKDSMKIIELTIPQKLNHKKNRRFSMENESSYFSTSELDEPFSPYGVRKFRNAHFSASSSGFSSPCISPFYPRILCRHACNPECGYAFSPANNWTIGSSSNSQSSSDDCKPFRPHSYAAEYKPQLKPRMMDPHSSPMSRSFKEKYNVSPPSAPHSPCFCPRAGNREILFPRSSPTSPWVNRRIVNQRKKSTSSLVSSNHSTPHASPLLQRRSDGARLIPDNVIRLPKGPKDTLGFASRNPRTNINGN